MGYIPQNFPPKEIFKSDEDWYNHCRRELVEARTHMSKTYKSAIITSIIITVLIIVVGLLIN